MKIKTSDLTGITLDWAVAKAKERPILISRKGLFLPNRITFWCPSKIWSQGGLIIEQEKIGIGHAWEGADWLASAYDPNAPTYTGPTPLIAAMRCYVASKLGDEIEVPDELVEKTQS